MEETFNYSSGLADLFINKKGGELQILQLESLDMTKLLAKILILLFATTAQANAASLNSISTKELHSIVTDNTDLKLVFFFTSWCGVCKSSLKDLFVLKAKYDANPRVKIIAVSIDDNYYLIHSFVKSLPASIDYKVYHLDPYNSTAVANMFRTLNIRYTGSIPHVGLFGKNGKVLADGNYKVSGFSEGIDKFLALE
ncbi:MAG: TlpA family protein disulfide reductase [Rickettsiales bacterium]